MVASLYAFLSLPPPTDPVLFQSGASASDRAVAIRTSTIVAVAVRALTNAPPGSLALLNALTVLQRVCDAYRAAWDPCITLAGQVLDPECDLALRLLGDALEPVMTVLAGLLPVTSTVATAGPSSGLAVGSGLLRVDPMAADTMAWYPRLCAVSALALPARRARNSAFRVAAVAAGVLASAASIVLTSSSDRMRIAVLGLLQGLGLSEEAVVVMGAPHSRLLPVWLALPFHASSRLTIASIRAFRVFFLRCGGGGGGGGGSPFLLETFHTPRPPPPPAHTPWAK